MLHILTAAILVAPTADGSSFWQDPRYNLLAGQKNAFGLEFVAETCQGSDANFRFDPPHEFTFRCLNQTRGVLEFNLTETRLFTFFQGANQLFTTQILPTKPSQAHSFVESTASAVAQSDGAVFSLTARDVYGNAIPQLCSTAAVQVFCTCQCELVSAVLEEEKCLLSLSLNLLVFAKHVKITFSSYDVLLGDPLTLTVRFGSSASVWINAVVGGLLMLCSLFGYWWAFLRKR